MDEWLTTEEISEALKVEPRTVRRWLRSGELRGINFGGKTGWRVRRQDLDAYIEQQFEGKAAA